MIQVGIIGSGFIGPAHIEALRRLGGVNVVALCDSSLAVAQNAQRLFIFLMCTAALKRCWRIWTAGSA